MNMENFEEQLRKDLHQFLLSMMNKKQSMKHLMIFAAVIIHKRHHGTDLVQR